MTEYFGTRDEKLPAKFTAAERAAYVWLYDCGVTPWLVDLVTKRVSTPGGEFVSLVAYREHIEQSRTAGEGSGDE